MRLLHARLHHGVGRPAAPQSASDRRRDPRSARQQHLPLHRLCEDHRGGEARRRAARRRSCRHERDRARRAISAATCRWSTARRRSPAAPNTPPTSSRPACSPAASTAAPIRTARSSRSTSPRREKLPGVKAIVTGADCDKTFGVLPIARSEHPLARDKVRYRGEPVAAVAAVDDATARKALSLIKLKVRELPAYYTVEGRARARRRQLHEQQAGQHRARRVLRARQCRAGLRRRRSGARGHLQLRRSLPEPDGDARRDRRLRSRRATA